MATQFTLITPDEYNSARTQTVSVLGVTTTGTTSATQGYGQAVSSSAVGQFQKVTEADLDNLRLDIVKAYTHQNGSAPTITNVTKDTKAAASLFNSYTSLASGISANKNVVADNQLVTVTRSINTETYAAYEGVEGTGGGWKNYANHTVIVTFSSADDARYFFNAGSKFIFSASRTGGTTSPTIGLDQNTSWTNLLDTITAEAPTFAKADFYTLTDTFATWYNKNATGPTYSANYYRISVKSNVANNQYGGATQIQFKVEFVDAYNDGNTTNYDGVDGTFTSTMVEKSPKGVASGGAITVPKPFSYSTSPATGFNEQGTPIYITAAYTVTPSPTSVTENNATINFTFDATNYNTGNTVTFKIIASSTVGLNDFVQTGWTVGPNTAEGYKTLTKTATNTGSYASSSCSVSITTNPDATTEGTETFTIEATGTADGSGGGFPVTATFTITDSSKTPTPGITVQTPFVSGGTPEVSAIVGEGYTDAVTGSWGIKSTPLTGSASLTVYGFYVDLINASGISGYKITLPGGTIVEPGNSYYTLPTPVVLAPDQIYSITIAIYSNSGPAGWYNTAGNAPVLRIRSNGGSADGSGPSTAPSYNVKSVTLSAKVEAATINFAITASSTSYLITFPPGGTATGNMFLYVRNNGNARGTVSNYSVSSNSGNLSVTYNNSLNGTTIGAGQQTLDTVGLSSNTAGTYYVTASVTGNNNYTAPSTYTRNDLQVTVEQLFPEINVTVSSVNAVVGAQTGDITVTYTNTGGATLTISNVNVTLGQYITGFTQTQTRPGNTLAPGASMTNKFTVRRLRIGTSAVTVTVTSDAKTNPTFTATGNVTTVATSPTLSIYSTNGSVTNSTSFSTKAVIKKESNIYVTISNTEVGACHPIAAQWEDGTLHQAWIDIGVTKPIDAMTNLSSQFCNAIGSGTFTPWKGDGGSEETAAWKTGVGKIWVAVKTGLYDNGTQSYLQIAGRMGDGVNQSTNQVRIDVEIVPNPKLLVSPTSLVQGETFSWEARGITSNATVYALGTLQYFPNSVTTFSESDPAIQRTVNENGRFVSSGTTETTPVGTYVRYVKCYYKGTAYTSSNAVFEILSPAYYAEPAFQSDTHPQLNGMWVNSTGDANTVPVGEKYYFRRTGAGNGTYLVALFGWADDQCEIFVQGISRGTATMSTNAINSSMTVSVTDGYVHWAFRYYNTGGPGHFAVAIWLGTPLVFYGGTGSNLGPSRW